MIVCVLGWVLGLWCWCFCWWVQGLCDYFVDVCVVGLVFIYIEFGCEFDCCYWLFFCFEYQIEEFGEFVGWEVCVDECGFGCGDFVELGQYGLWCELCEDCFLQFLLMFYLILVVCCVV